MVMLMNKIGKYIGIGILCLFAFILTVKANDNIIYVDLSNLKYSTDNSNYDSIKEYSTLEEFLIDYNSNNLPDIYITNFLFDGVSSVKVLDLDDYIEKDSNDLEMEELKIKVINVNTTGDIEFSGTIKGAMIGVDTNNRKGNINLILNNVNLDTDSKKAPAIYVYNKDKNDTNCIVTIKTKTGTKNYIEGGKLKKVSLVGSDELSNYKNYYSNDALTNYNKYLSYYGVYTSSEIKNILFAKVEADSEDLADGDPYYFYKASGAISSDIDLYFEGNGYLKVTSKKDEGIETKGNLTFSGGTGDYEIIAMDDALNTTTTSSSNTTVRNDITIDVNSLIAIVNEEAEEGDAIDSNGKLIINGGTIYAFANPKIQDAGLDSTNGTYINGGTVIATGNMIDEISKESKQKYLFASFNQISADTLIVIKDQSNNIITAFKTSRNIQNLLYSSSDLNYNSYKIYTGGKIDGEETNGLYTKINSYSGGTEISYNDSSQGMNQQKNESNISNVLLIALIIEIISLIIVVSILKIINQKNRNSSLTNETSSNEETIEGMEQNE